MEPRRCAVAVGFSDEPEGERERRHRAVLHHEKEEGGADTLDWRALERELEDLLGSLTGEKSELAQAKTLGRAKTVYETRHPEARRGGDRNQTANFATCPGFAAYAAARCGFSVRTVYNRIKAASDLEALDQRAERAAYGTAAANKIEFLRRVAGLPKPDLHLDLIRVFDLSQKKGRRELRKWEDVFGLAPEPKPARQPEPKPDVDASLGDVALLARIREALGVDVNEAILPEIDRISRTPGAERAAALRATQVEIGESLGCSGNRKEILAAVKKLKRLQPAVLELRAELSAAERRAGRAEEELKIYTVTPLGELFAVLGARNTKGALARARELSRAEH